MITFSKLGKYGRLGNQLFQVAAVLGYAHKYNTSYFLPKWEYAKYFKHNFNTQNRRVHNIWREPDFTYSPIPAKSNLDLEGYFQSEKYFEGVDIKKYFEPREDFETVIEDRYGDLFTKETCSVHVRRGDYLNLKDYHYNLDLSYYINAIDRFDYENTRFVIFSDDIRWCKEHFDKHNSIFIEGNSDLVDMWLMSKCNHNIIANSSFSWWGSYLNQNPDKKVIAPTKDKWFGPMMNKSVEDLYLKNWILI